MSMTIEELGTILSDMTQTDPVSDDSNKDDGIKRLSKVTRCFCLLIREDSS